MPKNSFCLKRINADPQNGSPSPSSYIFESSYWLHANAQAVLSRCRRLCCYLDTGACVIKRSFRRVEKSWKSNPLITDWQIFVYARKYHGPETPSHLKKDLDTAEKDTWWSHRHLLILLSNMQDSKSCHRAKAFPVSGQVRSLWGWDCHGFSRQRGTSMD